MHGGRREGGREEALTAANGRRARGADCGKWGERGERSGRRRSRMLCSRAAYTSQRAVLIERAHVEEGDKRRSKGEEILRRNWRKEGERGEERRRGRSNEGHI